MNITFVGWQIQGCSTSITELFFIFFLQNFKFSQNFDHAYKNKSMFNQQGLFIHTFNTQGVIVSKD